MTNAESPSALNALSMPTSVPIGSVKWLSYLSSLLAFLTDKELPRPIEIHANYHAGLEAFSQVH